MSSDPRPDTAAVAGEVGARIRTARTAAGLAQRDLAERLGVSQAAVSSWENGEGRGVTVAGLLEVAHALGIDAAALLPQTPAPPPAPATPAAPSLTEAERIAADLFAPSCIHAAGEPCDECEARAREFVAALAPAILAACPDCVTSEAALLGVAAVVNVVRYGHSPFAVPMLERGSLSWEVAEAISRGRHRGLAGHPPTDRPEAPAPPPSPPALQCPNCGSSRYVSASFDGGWTRKAQCVPCGRVHAHLGDGWRVPSRPPEDAPEGIESA